MNICRSTYYYKHRAPDRDKIELEKRIILCFQKHDATYGKKRIKWALAHGKDPVCVSLTFIARILRKHNLIAKAGRRKAKRRKPEGIDPNSGAANLIKDKNAVKVSNALWCFDNTELHCKDGKFYACGGIDAATKRIVGLCQGLHQDANLAHEALMEACSRNPVRPPCAVYHSDNGSCFRSKKISKDLAENNLLRSLSRPAHPMDNQPIETFWHTMKTEMPDISQMSYEEATLTVFEYVVNYNGNRIHSGIGYATPNEMYKKLFL